MKRGHSSPVDFFARKLWWGMLWFMRRPWMKRLQRWSWQIQPESRREKARLSLQRQNLFALKYGLRLLRLTVMLFFGSVMLTLSYLAVLELQQAGAFEVPREVGAPR